MQRGTPLAKLLKDGPDPITFFCRVLANESAPEDERREAARLLRPYYHPLLAQMGPLLDRFGKED